VSRPSRRRFLDIVAPLPLERIFNRLAAAKLLLEELGHGCARIDVDVVGKAAALVIDEQDAHADLLETY
jgi:hypothetical protein